MWEVGCFWLVFFTWEVSEPSQKWTSQERPPDLSSLVWKKNITNNFKIWEQRTSFFIFKKYCITVCRRISTFLLLFRITEQDVALKLDKTPFALSARKLPLLNPKFKKENTMHRFPGYPFFQDSPSARCTNLRRWTCRSWTCRRGPPRSPV